MRRFSPLALVVLLLIPIYSGAQNGGRVKMDFLDVPINDFVRAFAAATGRNYILGPNIGGKVSIVSQAELTMEQAEFAFAEVLRVNGLRLVEGNGISTIVSLAEQSGIENLAEGTEFRVLQINTDSVGELASVLRSRLPDDVEISSLLSARTIVISGSGHTIRKHNQAIDAIVTPAVSNFQVIRLKSAHAENVLQIIQNLRILSPDSSIAAERQTNSLIVSAPASVQEKVLELVRSLDSNTGTATSRVFEVTHASPNRLVEILAESFSSDERSAIQISADESTNSLFVRAPSELFPEIERSIRQLDRRIAQVLIEAVVFELAVDDFSDVSVQFGGALNGIIAGGIQYSRGNQPPLASLVSSFFSGTAPPIRDGATIAAINRGQSGDGLAALLGALASKSSTNLLATPSLLTLNNQEAEIIVAKNVPFVTGSYSTTGENGIPATPFQTIDRQDVGLVLRVQPRISSDRVVRLDVEQDVSSLTGAASAAGGEITSKRSLKTSVLVGDGEVVVLGGLLEQIDNRSNSGVPGIQSVPLLGDLLSSKQSTRSKRVLLLLIRPQIIVDPVELKHVSQAIQTTQRSAVREENGGVLGDFESMRDPSIAAQYQRIFRNSVADSDRQTGQWPALPLRLTVDDLIGLE